ncbi:Enoyl-[acyl-carrier-protein] reductase (NADH) [Rubellimicrobium thermophilum DSM 16684]|uniref:enoyl-[acyl-carrier-protein] reductase (NADH) n=1 Tax=Rubellimicrobium thermophilum DSM 16684 TaxID=1123069 RepID=S9SBG8_9RHOB|nr:Enoyl-[acyl-carrier-protein] reductase (NADH) [Rubellimicrobium thermophilum DSM 16684]
MISGRGDPRQCHQPRTDEDAAGAAIGGARATYRHTQENAPLRANATLEAVGGTAVWLASEAGACTTGEIVHVDGGFHVLGMPQPGHL